MKLISVNKSSMCMLEIPCLINRVTNSSINKGAVTKVNVHHAKGLKFC